MKAEESQPNDNGKELLSRRDAIKGFAKVAGAVAVGTASASQAAEPGDTPAAGQPQNPYGGAPNTGITLPPYYRPTPSVKNANTFFPQAEELGGDEMRIPCVPEPERCRRGMTSCSTASICWIGSSSASAVGQKGLSLAYKITRISSTLFSAFRWPPPRKENYGSSRLRSLR
jgi:hypothetical protein